MSPRTNVLRAALLGATLVGLVVPLPLSSAAGGDSDEAIRWLQRAAGAPDRISFHATQVLTSWGPQGASSAMLEVTHTSQGTQLVVLGAGASHGVKTFVQRAAHNSGPVLDGGPLALLKLTYDLQLAGVTEVNGRRAVVVEARRSDGTLAARFWIDQATGLLLQRHLFTMDGRQPVRVTAYTSLRIDPGSFIGHLPPAIPDDDAVESIGAEGATKLRSEGWNCADRLPDSLRLHDVHLDSDGAVQLSYSDGLFAVSVFEQRGRLDPAAMGGYTATTTTDGAPVYVRYGMPSYAVWASDGIVYTLVGDIPYDVMARVVAAFPHDVPDPVGVVDRIGNGLAKMAKWLTPTGAVASKLG